MSDDEYCFKPEFLEVEAYVRNGLPKEHYFRDDEKVEEGKRPSKCWFDTDQLTGEHGYDQYCDNEVKNAARFRDGLVSEIYKEFRLDFSYPFWAEEYKKNSEIVYRSIHNSLGDEYCICDEDAHIPYGDGAFCSKSVDQINLMEFHIGPIQGDQADKLMRLKVFSVLLDDIQKLHKGWSKERSKKSQVRYVHALAVVLCTIVNQQYWIGWKVYSSDDFDEFFDATARIQNVMNLLVKDEIFDDANMYKVFTSYNSKIQEIDRMNNRWVEMFETENIKKKRFFTSSFLSKMSAMENSFILKYGEQRVETTEGDEGIEKNGDGEEKKSEGEESNVDKSVEISCLCSSTSVGSKRKNETP
jgi:hypothetical protein